MQIPHPVQCVSGIYETACALSSMDESQGEEGRKTMALHVRRVITGHDTQGHAIVQIDEVATHLAVGRPGATVCSDHYLVVTSFFPLLYWALRR